MNEAKEENLLPSSWRKTKAKRIVPIGDHHAGISFSIAELNRGNVAIGQEVALPVSFSSLAIAQAGDPVSIQQKSTTTMHEDEVLIRVEYASINKMDPGLARVNVYNFPFPYVLGFDFSGEVAKVGAQCQEAFKVGDEVLGWSLTWRLLCRICRCSKRVHRTQRCRAGAGRGCIWHRLPDRV